MRTLLRSLALALGLFATVALHAQTYSPKDIRIEGATGMDNAQLLGIADLKAGTTLTKEQIEAALQRLGDTGFFADLSYTVNAEALVFKVTPAASSRSLPARYANFIWWTPSELEPLVEAKVPLFHGQLPSAGTLTDQVEAALVSLLRDKGILDGTVTAIPSANGAGGSISGVTLSITHPQIVIGNVDLQGALPALKPKLADVQRNVSGQDLDIEETANSIRDSVADVYRNAGFLDITNDPTTYAPPRKDKDRYVVDTATVLHQGELYHVAQVEIQPALPLSPTEQLQATELKKGDPASVMASRIGQGLLGRAYENRGYLKASVAMKTAKDSTTHTVAYNFTVAPGSIYRLASIDASALPTDMQNQILRSAALKPGVIIDEAFTKTLLSITTSPFHSTKGLHEARKLDEVNHTVTLKLGLDAVPH